MKSLARNLPPTFLERLEKIIPRARWDKVANSFTEKKPTTFRVNRLHASRNAIRDELSQSGFRLSAVPWFLDAFILVEGNLRALQETPCYRDGKIYVQSLSSMIPVLVLGPQPGETILDLTAAPGSKTTQISMMMHDEGKIVANDNHKTRFFRLKANVDQQRATNVELSLHYGEGFGRKFPERFDRVLLDAPCSAEGRFLATEPKSFGYWKPRKVNEMARKQRKLLFSAIHALKPGGVLVYSTCTFAPEENEALIHWAVEKFKGSLEVSDIRLPLPNRMLGLTAWEGKAFHPTTAKTLRILPDSVMEGFFVAKLTKTHTVPC